jgi:hypothetical protein
MSKQDDYLQSQLQQILQPGEQVHARRVHAPSAGLLMQILLVGGLLLFMMTKAYFAVLTNRRLIFIRTKMSFWTGGPKEMNIGVEQYDARRHQERHRERLAQQPLDDLPHGGRPSKQTLRISPWFKQISGTKAFFEQVPTLVTSGQLAQLAAGGGGGGYQQMPQQAGGFAPQGGGFAPQRRLRASGRRRLSRSARA